MPGLTVLIPAFNEGETVADVVKAALGAELGPVIVIDDGSRDDTALRAQLAGARVLWQTPNAGKAG
ncbi:glycosyltransferase family 2 protein [Deinococcus antarcticus]|uniref:Glycosyltransferase family 2 protein n=1 Tax=Deinococcus antarcticus TaxID=1298767 RepID=A0ABV8A5T4_9DEIO